MSSRREVLIRILALLQGKTFIETKNRRLKCLKWHYSTVGSMKKGCSGIFPLFSSPPRGIRQLKSRQPREFAIQGKNANARGSARGGGGGEAGLRWNWLMRYCDRQECLGGRRNKKDRVAGLFSSRWFDQILARSWSYWCIEKDKHRYINGPDLRGKLFVFSVVARVISLPRNYHVFSH